MSEGGKATKTALRKLLVRFARPARAHEQPAPADRPVEPSPWRRSYLHPRVHSRAFVAALMAGAMMIGPAHADVQPMGKLACAYYAAMTVSMFRFEHMAISENRHGHGRVISAC